MATIRVLVSCRTGNIPHHRRLRMTPVCRTVTTITQGGWVRVRHSLPADVLPRTKTIHRTAKSIKTKGRSASPSHARMNKFTPYRCTARVRYATGTSVRVPQYQGCQTPRRRCWPASNLQRGSSRVFFSSISKLGRGYRLPDAASGP